MKLAFTITELMVVIGIMVLLMAVGTLSYRAMFNGRRVGSAINVISSASSMTRSFCSIERASVVPTYINSGTAMIFAPSGELRLTDNVWYLRDGDGNLLEDGTDERSGYDDIPNIGYVSLPRGIVAVGLVRTDAGALCIAPPFAVRFDRDGHLIAGQNDRRIVYYNGDYSTDSRVTISSSRPEGYDPSKYDSESAKYDPSTWNAVARKHNLPFDQIETVVAVVVFDLVAFADAGHTLVSSSEPSHPINAAASQWILQNGLPLFFNRYTGAVIRER